MSDDPKFYFCLVHHTVEGEDGCRAQDRLGPYATRAEAERVLSAAIAALGDPKPESVAQLERLLRERALVRRGRGDVSGAERDVGLAEAVSRKAQPATSED